jgi:hypothetical protein
MNTGIIGEGLRHFFTEYLYSALVIGIFLFLLFYKFALVLRARGDSRVRRLTAAILPFLVLIFALLPVDGKILNYPRIEGIPLTWQFISGVLVATAILELGRWLKRLDAEIAAATYILFIALIDTYMLYSMIENSLGHLHFLLFGMVVGGGFYVIFRGTPLFSEEKEESSGDLEGEGQRFEKISSTRPSIDEARTIPRSGTSLAPDSGPPSGTRKRQTLRNSRDDSLENNRWGKEANSGPQADG